MVHITSAYRDSFAFLLHKTYGAHYNNLDEAMRMMSSLL